MAEVPVRKKVGDLLIQAGIIDEDQLRSALAEQRKWGGALGKVLVNLGFCTEEALVQTLSSQLNMPAVKLDSRTPDPAALKMLPADFCQEHQVFPFAFTAVGKFLDVAVLDPTDLTLIDEVRVRTRANVRPYLAGAQSLDAAIRVHYLGEAAARPAGKFDSWGISTAVDVGGALPTGQFGAAPGGGQTPRHSGVTGRFDTLSARVAALEARVERDEQVIRKLMKLLVDKGVTTR
ncbi:MAG: hypothetical protein AABZ30_12515, partial [Myxococcota bacterium]